VTLPCALAKGMQCRGRLGTVKKELNEKSSSSGMAREKGKGTVRGMAMAMVNGRKEMETDWQTMDRLQRARGQGDSSGSYERLLDEKVLF
jgi:hypothetical protein